MDTATLLGSLGIEDPAPGAWCGDLRSAADAPLLESFSPTDGARLGAVRLASRADYEAMVARSQEVFRRWRVTPAPVRGEVVRQIGLAFREHKAALGRLISLEMGKILTEGEGEIQECIDIADFAVGLSRQLHGLAMHSERPSHRMYEQWHPLGPIGIITAFNFPAAVWAWNAMVAAVCGDTMIWKPSPETPLVALACHRLAEQVLERHGFAGVMGVCMGTVEEVGAPMVDDRRLPLISATGSCAMGRTVGERVARRLGRSLLELGGNNAIIVMDDADLDMTLRGVLFGAVGTAGQRCTTTRRVLMQADVARPLTDALVKAYPTIRIGDPLDPDTLMGPLIHADAVQRYAATVDRIRQEGGEILCGGNVLTRDPLGRGHFVEPTLVRAPADLPVMREETFAPILYLVEVQDLDEALVLHNSVDQGLSSAIFTNRLQHAERFLGHAGSDCGIANVNLGTSGAEIGGAFGGEKDTGGGRESGSDAWKAYMRRQTCTINHGSDLPLAQGVEFHL